MTDVQIQLSEDNLTRDGEGTPISSTTSRIIPSNISCETLLFIFPDSVKSSLWWWADRPISSGCQLTENKFQQYLHMSAFMIMV